MSPRVVPFSCPICNSSKFKTVKIFTSGVTVGRCLHCDLLYTPIRDEKPEELFTDIDYSILRFLYNPIKNGFVKHFRQKNFEQYISIINKFSNGKKLLDIGCAHGFFSFYAKQNGYEVSAIEPDANMGRFATEELGVHVSIGTLDKVDLENKKWDIISFTDSLEYFINPVQDLSALRINHLSEKGIVFIKVPNGDYFNFRHNLKKHLKISIGRAEAFSPPKRVAHYTFITIQNLLKTAGYTPVTINHIAPVDSPAWHKYTGLWLEFASPKCLGRTQRITRKLLHYFGLIEFFFFRRNHLSQSIYIVAKI